MREEAHRILYVVVNSVAMNGYSSSTRFVSITPQWIIMVNSIRTCYIASSIFVELNKKRKKINA